MCLLDGIAENVGVRSMQGREIHQLCGNHQGVLTYRDCGEWRKDCGKLTHITHHLLEGIAVNVGRTVPAPHKWHIALPTCLHLAVHYTVHYTKCNTQSAFHSALHSAFHSANRGKHDEQEKQEEAHWRKRKKKRKSRSPHAIYAVHGAKSSVSWRPQLMLGM